MSTSSEAIKARVTAERMPLVVFRWVATGAGELRFVWHVDSMPRKNCSIVWRAPSLGDNALLRGDTEVSVRPAARN